MSYDPKIYIRGYGAPDHRVLAFWGGFALDGKDIAPKRHLIVHAEGADTAEPYLLLSGDMSDGDDFLSLSGVGNDLMVIMENGAFRLFGPDVTLTYSIIYPVDVTVFDMTAGDASLNRHLLLRTDLGALELVGNDVGLLQYPPLNADTGVFAVSGQDIGLIVDWKMVAGSGGFALTGNISNLNIEELIELSGDMSDGDDLAMLSGDMQDGADFIIISKENL